MLAFLFRIIAALLQPLMMFLQILLRLAPRFLGLFQGLFRLFQSGIWLIIERIVSVGGVFFSSFKFLNFLRNWKK